MARGEYGLARERLDVALALIREAKPEEVLVSLVLRAQVARVEGDLLHARRLLDEALPLARAGVPVAAAALQAMAELAVAEENPRAARRLERRTELARGVPRRLSRRA